MENKYSFINVTPLKLMTAKHLLDEAKIEYFVIDKRDTAYTGLIDSVEIRVDSAKEEEAIRIFKAAEII